MSSTAGTNPYTYVKPSELATRSLVSGSKPDATTSSASHDHPDTPTHDRPVLHRKQTDNYEQAVAREQANKQDAGADMMVPGESAERPGINRQQSWKIQDQRRQFHEKLVGEGVTGHGYHSTGQ